MLRQFVLEEHGIASLADNRTIGVRERRGARRLLPSDDTSAIDKGGVGMAIMARASSVYGGSLLAVLVDCAGSTGEFSFLSIWCLVEQEVELDGSPRLPVVFLRGEGLEPDANFLRSALGKKNSSTDIGSYFPRKGGSVIPDWPSS